ncbi:Anti-sigma-W factor RsiW [compost metagenome]
MHCPEAVALMHDYFDGDLDAVSASALRTHLEACPACRKLFKQFEGTEALVRVPLKSTVPVGLTDGIMSSIPQASKRSRWAHMIKLHPVAAAACAILIILLAHYTSRVYSDQDMVVQGALDQLFISGDTLVVPEGVTVYGNLKVKRGKIQIDGNVEGDVTIINGSYNLASTAYISGRVTVIDAALDWIRYRIRNLFIRGPSFRGGSFFQFR